MTSLSTLTANRVRLGRTGLEVFPLALGTNTFGWTAGADTSKRILDAFVEAGGNLIDSADVYSIWAAGSTGGDSEAIIGQWLTATGARDKVLLTSKVSGHPQFPGLSAQNIRSGIERTLSRMKTDYLDVYFAHKDDPNTPLEESVAAFDELVRRGVVRQVGLSNFSGARIQRWIDIATATGAAPPSVLQPYYNLLTRHVFETELRPIVERNDLGTMPYFGLGSAFLTGKYRKAGDAKGVPRSMFMASYLTDAGFAVVDELMAVAAERAVAPAAVALAWLRAQRGVTAPIASVSSTDQLPALLASASLELTSRQTERLTRISDAFAG